MQSTVETVHQVFRVSCFDVAFRNFVSTTNTTAASPNPNLTPFSFPIYACLRAALITRPINGCNATTMPDSPRRGAKIYIQHDNVAQQMSLPLVQNSNKHFSMFFRKNSRRFEANRKLF